MRNAYFIHGPLLHKKVGRRLTTLVHNEGISVALLLFPVLGLTLLGCKTATERFANEDRISAFIPVFRGLASMLNRLVPLWETR